MNLSNGGFAREIDGMSKRYKARPSSFFGLRDTGFNLQIDRTCYEVGVRAEIKAEKDAIKKAREEEDENKRKRKK